MINVLPQQEKRILRHEYWMRFASITLFLFSLACIFAALLLFPSYFFSQSKATITENRLFLFNQTNKDLETGHLDRVIGEINAHLDLLATYAPSAYPSKSVFEFLLGMRIPGITYSQILYAENPAGKRTVELHGVARDRAALRTFKTALDNNPHILSADLPIAYFLERTDNNFTISITLK